MTCEDKSNISPQKPGRANPSPSPARSLTLEQPTTQKAGVAFKMDAILVGANAPPLLEILIDGVALPTPPCAPHYPKCD